MEGLFWHIGLRAGHRSDHRHQRPQWPALYTPPQAIFSGPPHVKIDLSARVVSSLPSGMKFFEGPKRSTNRLTPATERTIGLTTDEPTTKTDELTTETLRPLLLGIDIDIDLL
jgi:hypothetical protein